MGSWELVAVGGGETRVDDGIMYREGAGRLYSERGKGESGEHPSELEEEEQFCADRERGGRRKGLGESTSSSNLTRWRKLFLPYGLQTFALPINTNKARKFVNTNYCNALKARTAGYGATLTDLAGLYLFAVQVSK